MQIGITHSSQTNGLNQTAASFEYHLNWDDLVWLHQNNLCIRNVDVNAGRREAIEGGMGDAYVMATFGFNPSWQFPAIESNQHNSEALAELKAFYKTMRSDGDYIPFDVYDFMLSEKIDALPEVKDSLVAHANQQLNEIVVRCYRSPKQNGELFSLFSHWMADRPYDFPRYPTGKVGREPFKAEQIIASIEEGIHFNYQRAKMANKPASVQIAEEEANVAQAQAAIIKLIQSRPTRQ